MSAGKGDLVNASAGEGGCDAGESDTERRGQTHFAETSQDVRSGISFEEGLKRLEEIVQCLEREDIALEEALKLWEEGAALVRQLESVLDRSQARIEQVLRDAEGRVYTIPVEREPG